MSDRKYRHRGYQDDGVKPSRRGPREARPERLEGAPRGRTAGGFGPSVFKCAVCGALQRAMGEVEPDSTCACGADLHTCTNCKHCDSSIRWECRVEIEERVSPKDSRNNCELFAPKIVKDLVAGKAAPVEKPDDARTAFDNLFKK